MNTYGTNSAFIYSRGPNTIKIYNASFLGGTTLNKSGGLLDIAEAVRVEIYSVKFL